MREIDLVRSLAAKGHPDRLIAVALERSYWAVAKLRQRFGIDSGLNLSWTDEERRLLYTYVGRGLTSEQIAGLLGRTKCAVDHQRSSFWATHRPKKPRWTDADEAKLREMFAAGVDDAEIAEALDRSLGAIKQRRVKLGLKYCEAQDTTRALAAHMRVCAARRAANAM